MNITMVVFLLTLVYVVQYFLTQVAWAISDKEDASTHKAVWSVMHTRCSTAVVPTLMTDDGNICS